MELSLLPNRNKPTITVSYNMREASGEVIDAEITTPMEGVLSTLSGLVKLSSKTGRGRGRITLTFDKETDMDAMRFEVSALMRQIKSSLPDQMSTPSISTNDPDEQTTENLLIYAINGPGDKESISEVINQVVVAKLAEIEGVNSVSLSGSESEEWHLRYNEKELKQAGVTTDDISTAFSNYYFDYQLGMVHSSLAREGEKISLVFSGKKRNDISYQNITFEKNGRIFYLKDWVDITLEKAKPSSYVRINGLNTIYLYISSNINANQLKCGRSVKKRLNALTQQLPDGYSFSTSYDATTYIKDEIVRISLRIGFSLLLLLLFVFVVYRSWRYMLITFISIISTLCLSFILYYLFHVQIHVYSMAGLTVSLGIIIDNTIVMTDHLKTHHGDRHVFLPILAATLTTIGSLVIVFFLDESQQLQLLDFAYVITINLTVSLLVALFFIPALVDKMHLFEHHKNRSKRIYLRIAKFTNFYERFVDLGIKHRIIFITVIILLFGFPMSKLPVMLEGENWGSQLYNKTIGTEWYGKNLKKPINVALGGFLNPFISKVKHRFSDSGERKTRLNIRGSLPQGATVEQMNNIMLKVENFLAQYDGIEQYITRVYSAQNGKISVSFTPEEEFGSLPFTVKDEVQSFCIDIASADWDITGVGRGFNNSLRDAYRNSRMVLYGYNLEQLKRYAFSLKEDLEKIPRVEKVFVNGKASHMDRIAYEYALDLDNNNVVHSHLNSGRLISGVRSQSQEQSTAFWLQSPKGRSLPVVLDKGDKDNSLWQFYNQTITLGEKNVKLATLGNIKKKRVADYINKVNMEYQLVVEFDFIGSYGQKEYILEELINDFLPRLSIGYRLETQRYKNGLWDSDDDDKHPVLWLLAILLIIYIICAILLESLLQPLAVIITIPISFIGVFITFFAFSLPFGDGGYAAMLLLSGLTVNSALYIINEFNNQKRRYNNGTLKAYLKAYNHKIIPILLTLSSTILGLVPFLFGGQKDPFWFSMAAGTIGGLTFSLVAVFVYLPLFVRYKKNS